MQELAPPKIVLNGSSCPVPKCNGSGHISGSFNTHRSYNTCPLLQKLKLSNPAKAEKMIRELNDQPMINSPCPFPGCDGKGSSCGGWQTHRSLAACPLYVAQKRAEKGLEKKKTKASNGHNDNKTYRKIANAQDDEDDDSPGSGKENQMNEQQHQVQYQSKQQPKRKAIQEEMTTKSQGNKKVKFSKLPAKNRLTSINKRATKSKALIFAKNKNQSDSTSTAKPAATKKSRSYPDSSAPTSRHIEDIYNEAIHHFDPDGTEDEEIMRPPAYGTISFYQMDPTLPYMLELQRKSMAVQMDFFWKEVWEDIAEQRKVHDKIFAKQRENDQYRKIIENTLAQWRKLCSGIDIEISGKRYLADNAEDFAWFIEQLGKVTKVPNADAIAIARKFLINCKRAGVIEGEVDGEEEEEKEVEEDEDEEKTKKEEQTLEVDEESASPLASGEKDQDDKAKEESEQEEEEEEEDIEKDLEINRSPFIDYEEDDDCFLPTIELDDSDKFDEDEHSPEELEELPDDEEEMDMPFSSSSASSSDPTPTSSPHSVFLMPLPATVSEMVIISRSPSSASSPSSSSTNLQSISI